MSADWNASVYHRVSEPQYDWGLSVLSRVTLAGDERALCRLNITARRPPG